MKLNGHRSLHEVARLAKGYPKLVLCLCDHYGIPLERRGRFVYLADQHLNEVISQVALWKVRPRMSGIGRPKPRLKLELVV